MVATTLTTHSGSNTAGGIGPISQAGSGVVPSGTVVCPDADVKLYVTASPEERARRRHRELGEAGEPADFPAVLADIQRRDERDESRPNAPLRMAPDAVLLDTTELDADAAFETARLILEKQVRP